MKDTLDLFFFWHFHGNWEAQLISGIMGAYIPPTHSAAGETAPQSPAVKGNTNVSPKYSGLSQKPCTKLSGLSCARKSHCEFWPFLWNLFLVGTRLSYLSSVKEGVTAFPPGSAHVQRNLNVSFFQLNFRGPVFSVVWETSSWFWALLLKILLTPFHLHAHTSPSPSLHWVHVQERQSCFSCMIFDKLV